MSEHGFLVFTALSEAALANARANRASFIKIQLDMACKCTKKKKDDYENKVIELERLTGRKEEERRFTNVNMDHCRVSKFSSSARLGIAYYEYSVCIYYKFYVKIRRGRKIVGRDCFL